MIIRVPLLLYRLGLGRVLGGEFLVITHVGRRTGRVYETVLKVLQYDRANGESIVASAGGEHTDWYRIFEAQPGLTVQIAGDRYVPQQRVVPADEALAGLAYMSL
jgi:deazaflavin-dependent oxidoreductase (nitroreductase family)